MNYPEIYEMVNRLSPITKNEWDKLESTFKVVTAKKNEILSKPGEEPDAFFCVLEGVTRNYFVHSNGREYTKALRGPLGLVGPYAEAIMGTPCKYFIEAVTKMKAVKFSFKIFNKLMEENKQWERLGRVVAEVNYLEKEKREYTLIHMSIAEKYQEFLQNFALFKDQIPQFQIASYLGVSPEALNRHLKKLKTRH